MDSLQEYLNRLFPKQQSAFHPTAVNSLLQTRPEAEISTPENFVRTGFLGDSGRQTANQLGLLGLSFAPGAGFSDYAGTFPSAQGGTETGFQQNISQGNYLTAVLQGLGAAGDAATLSAAALGPFAPVAAGLGTIAKAPRAVQRGVEGLIDVARPKIDEMGFFSQVEKSIMDNPQAKGTGQQFLAQLQKTPGVKPEEIQYTGLDTFLANKPTVTKTEIQDYLDTNKVQLQEVTLGSQQSIANRDEAIASRYGYEATVDDDGVAFFDPNLDDFVEFRDLPAAMRAEISNPQTEFGGVAKFGTYTLPGGENYREVLLTLPTKRLLESEARVVLGVPEGTKLSAADIEYATNVKSPSYQSSHFDQPNILAHMRLNDRVVDGKPTLFVEEIQSDWHQAGRKKGYRTGNERSQRAQVERELTATTQKRSRLLEESYALPDSEMTKFITMNEEIKALATHATKLEAKWSSLLHQEGGVPDAPFKTSWHELTIKKAINEAATNGYDQVAFTTGKTQADRFDLSKQVDSIDYRVSGFGDNARYELGVVDKSGQGVDLPQQFYSAQELENVVGKEVANKIISGEGQSGGGRMTLRGVDLQVGGEGMKGFYDKILPKSLEKMGKKYGVKPVLTEMDTPDGKVQVWKFPIPKEMSKTVQEQGQPLFQIGAGAAGLGTAGLLATEEDQF
jgi:hypothetical protein